MARRSLGGKQSSTELGASAVKLMARVGEQQIHIVQSIGNLRLKAMNGAIRGLDVCVAESKVRRALITRGSRSLSM